MTGGESSYEDVNAPVVGLIVLEVGVDDFERLVVGESDLTYVVKGIGDQSKEMVSILDGFGGGFVEIFSKLTPEAVEQVWPWLCVQDFFGSERGRVRCLLSVGIGEHSVLCLQG